MLLEYVQTRVVAGFTLVFLVVFGILTFKLYILKHQLEVRNIQLKNLQQQNKVLEQQIYQLEQEHKDLLSLVKKLKKQSKIVTKYTTKQQKIQRKKEQTQVQINNLIRKDKLDEKKIIQLINSFFDCNATNK